MPSRKAAATPKRRTRTRTAAKKRAVKKPSPSIQMFREEFGYGDWGQEPFEKLLRKYGHSTAWVYVAINRIATAASQIPVQIIRKDREGLPNAIVRTDKKLTRLLERPNPHQDWGEFVDACLVQMELAGNVFIEKVFVGEQVAQLWILNAARIRIVTDTADGSILGYAYDVGGQTYKLPADRVIHGKYTNPTSDLVGLAPITAARLSIDTDKTAQEWNNNFLHKGGWPSGAIEFDDSLGDLELRRTKKEVKQSIAKGKDSAGYVLILTGGGKYRPIAISPKDTDWLDARRMSRDEILAIFGVSPAVAGVYSNENTTSRSAGVEQQIKQFYRNTVAAKVRRLLGALNRSLVPHFSEEYKLVPDLRSIPALADDVQTEYVRAQSARILIVSGFPINKVMARFYPDMEPVPWGEVAWMNSSMVPIKGPDNPFAKVGGSGPDATDKDPSAKALNTEDAIEEVFVRIAERVARQDHGLLDGV